MIFRCLGCPKAYCDEHCPRPTYLIEKERRLKEELQKFEQERMRLKREKIEEAKKKSEAADAKMQSMPQIKLQTETKTCVGLPPTINEKEVSKVLISNQIGLKIKEVSKSEDQKTEASPEITKMDKQGVQNSLPQIRQNTTVNLNRKYVEGASSAGGNLQPEKGIATTTTSAVIDGTKLANVILPAEDSAKGIAVQKAQREVDADANKHTSEKDNSRAVEAMVIEADEEEGGLEYVDECSVMSYYGFKLPSNYMYVFCTPNCKERYEDKYLQLPLPNLTPQYKSLPEELREMLEQRVAMRLGIGNSTSKKKNSSSKKKSKKRKEEVEEPLRLGDLDVHEEIDHCHFDGDTVQEKLDQVELESQLPVELYRLLYNTTVLKEGHTNYLAGIGAWQGFVLPEEKALKRRKSAKKRNRNETLDQDKWKTDVTMFYEKLRRHFMQLRTETLTVLCDLVGICLCFSSRVNKNGVVSKARRRGVRTSDSREARARHLACMFTLPDQMFMDITPP